MKDRACFNAYGFPRFMDKKTLRRTIRATRSGLTTEERRTKNKAIRERLESHPLFQTAHTLLFYVSREDEVDTHALIQYWLGKKKIIVPTVLKEKKTLELHELTRWEDLAPGQYGIPEVPADPHTAFKKSLDLILVPGVAFDPEGHRLGYGKGYYDTLLHSHDTPTLGLAYDCQIIDRVPQEPHDRRVDIVLTETHTYPSS